MSRDQVRASNVEAVIQRLRAEGMQPVWVDRAPVFDKTTLLHALYQALQLPAWFGFNWDALEECLIEFGDVADTLVFHDFELLEERDPEVAETFLEILRSVSSNRESAFRGLVRVPDMITVPREQRENS
jgi:hypothetical protein